MDDRLFPKLWKKMDWCTFSVISSVTNNIVENRCELILELDSLKIFHYYYWNIWMIIFSSWQYYITIKTIFQFYQDFTKYYFENSGMRYDLVSYVQGGKCWYPAPKNTVRCRIGAEQVLRCRIAAERVLPVPQHLVCTFPLCQSFRLSN